MKPEMYHRLSTHPPLDDGRAAAIADAPDAGTLDAAIRMMTNALDALETETFRHALAHALDAPQHEEANADARAARRHRGRARG